MISFLVVVVLQWLGAALGLVCTAQPLEQRQSSGSPFSLYAYGNNINGLEVFYADGQAQIGDLSLSNATNKVPMYITQSDSNTNTWIAHANTTQSTQAAFRTYGNLSNTNLLALRQTNSVASPVAFTTKGNESGAITDTWWLYGETVMLDQTNGNFYAEPTDESGLYSLLWSMTQSASLKYIPVSLRTVRPVVA